MYVQRGGVKAAVAAGVQLVNISPIRADVLEEALTEWLAPRPSTDVAIMFGLAHTLLSECLHDQAFLDTYTTGFETFRGYLLGETDGVPKTAECTAEISEIPAETMRSLARHMASRRTMLSMSWSLTRHDHGEQPFWAAIALASMIGQIGLPGGGISFGYSAVNTVGLNFNMLKAASLPQFDNPIDRFIPVARISDMLLDPGKPFDYNGKRYTYPDIRAVYWAGGNPFHHHQDLNRMLKEWRQPDTIIVHDWCWNAAAKNADIVLPCTSHLERSNIAITPRDRFLIAMEEASAPAGDTRDDYDILRGVARHMGVEEKFSEGRTAEAWQRWIYDVSRQKVSSDGIEMPPLDELRRKGWHEVPPPAKPHVMLEAFRANPSVNPLRTPSGRIEIYSKNNCRLRISQLPRPPRMAGADGVARANRKPLPAPPNIQPAIYQAAFATAPWRP